MTQTSLEVPVSVCLQVERIYVDSGTTGSTLEVDTDSTIPGRGTPVDNKSRSDGRPRVRRVRCKGKWTFGRCQMDQRDTTPLREEGRGCGKMEAVR